MNTEQIARDRLQALAQNEYPGRGIIIGQTPDAQHYVQIYWIMGRSENSLNRIFEIEGESLRTKAFDEKKAGDPSLIIYYPARRFGQNHIITNGDQTDTIYDCLKKGSTFEAALQTRQYEPDAPNYTPRISGIVSLQDGSASYSLSILKALGDDKPACQRHFFCYETFTRGYGHCIHTYRENGNPIPSFDGEPYLLPIEDTIEHNLESYWNSLNAENRISLMVKFIAADGSAKTAIMNKNR